jgi:hypothetical protein
MGFEQDFRDDERIRREAALDKFPLLHERHKKVTP